MNPPPAATPALAAQARQVFVRHLIDDLPQVLQRLLDDLQERIGEAVYSEASQRLQDSRVRLQTLGPAWLAQAKSRWSQSLRPATPAVPGGTGGNPLSLVAEEAVESQILAARAALVAVDNGHEALNELRLRLQHLELTDELDKRDPVLALNVMQALVDAWLDAGLTRGDWQHNQALLHKLVAKVVAAGYDEANRFLLSRGVLPQIDLRDLVKRSGRAGAATPPAAAAPTGVPSRPGGFAATGFRPSGYGGLTHVVPLRTASGGAPLEPGPAPGLAGAVPDAPVDGRQVVAQRLSRFMAERVPGFTARYLPATAGAPGPASAGSPSTTAAAGSPAAVAPPAWLGAVALPPVDWSSLEAGAAGAKAQARALKQAARSDEEKALIELVALIFDGILSEDRIPASIRVWFARLQMPVLRHALSDASFLRDEAHPARVLIDRMGACVLGFDPSVPLSALEAEIKRIVQVVEQYPETGRRVFELMLQEFQAFLGRALRPTEPLQRVTDLAGQLERKGALTVQYTLELRRLLGTAPVHEGLRDFFFHTWVEVMAQAAVVHGAQHAQAVQVRQLAADLLWAAATKPTRHERAQVIARVPALMAQLREGLALLGLDAAQQEVALQPVSDALAAAFLSRSAAIDPDWLAGFTAQLGHLEAVLTDGDGDAEPVPLSRESLELVTGEDASRITVLANPDNPAPKHLLAWAAALPLGSWYRLEHNGQPVVVQLAWQSPRRQLFLFVTATQHGFLLEQGRVAHYLKAGLLRAAQTEPLTTQATRQALDKLQANPERLLG
ncbi:DUF1631 family protein [Aquabacterium sp. A08]|uniref:DUF1631 family protein n=1 Tax=Aquabacterium sp. A08 TaxID=2718532 RepID=UPI00141EACF3|nr:DUF1631 family protein [Aquabacterium sp. A08]NIC43000.1 DUF1631 domain-containing protein [Aquabacterium sp. A08]